MYLLMIILLIPRTKKWKDFFKIKNLDSNLVFRTVKPKKVKRQFIKN